MGEGEQERDRILDAEEVAEMLKVSRARVYDMTRRKLIPHARLGRQVRYWERALTEWLLAGGTPLPGVWREKEADPDG